MLFLFKSSFILCCILLLTNQCCFCQPGEKTETKTVVLTTKRFKKTVVYEDKSVTIWANYNDFRKWCNDAYKDVPTARKYDSLWVQKVENDFLKRDTVFLGGFACHFQNDSALSHYRDDGMYFGMAMLDSGFAHVRNNSANHFEDTILVVKTTEYEDIRSASGFTAYRAKSDSAILLSIGWGWEKSTTLSNVHSWGECSDGIMAAKADAAKGILKLKRWGYPVYEYHPYTVYSTIDILKSEYGILYQDEGCIYYDAYECYNNYMDSLIKAKYGKDVFDKCAAKADSMTRKGMMKSYEEFPGGHDSLIIYLIRQTANVSFNCDSLNGIVTFDFVVDGQGKIDSVSKRSGICFAVDDDLEAIIRSMPQWTAARNGLNQPVSSQTCISFIFKSGKIERIATCFHIK